MRRYPSLPHLLHNALFCFVLIGAIPLAAQPPAPPPPTDEGDSVTAVLSGEGRPRYPLAFPAAELGSPMSDQVATAARELEQTLRDDLEISRVFDIQGPWALSVLELTGDPVRDLQLYRSLGNEILLLTEIEESGDRVVFEGRLIDLKNGQSIVGKRYQGGVDVVRTIAHTMADEILLYLIGRRGIALTNIAFSSDRTGSKEIYLMDYDGRNQRRLTQHRSISLAPAWKPSGDSLTYVSFVNGQPGIYNVELATGTKTPTVAGSGSVLAPAISPDGRRIAYSRSLDGNSEIFVARIDGSGERRLTRSRAIDTNPAWSPDGKTLAFTSSRVGNPHIFLMDLEGANVRRVSFGGDYNDGAAFHPDGGRLVYASRRGGIFQIAVTEIVTLDTATLTAGAHNKERPTYSPDGRRIAYSVKRGSRTQIYVMDADGRYSRQLTEEGNNSSPSWSPYFTKKKR